MNWHLDIFLSIFNLGVNRIYIWFNRWNISSKDCSKHFLKWFKAIMKFKMVEEKTGHVTKYGPLIGSKIFRSPVTWPNTGLWLVERAMAWGAFLFIQFTNNKTNFFSATQQSIFLNRAGHKGMNIQRNEKSLREKQWSVN